MLIRTDLHRPVLGGKYTGRVHYAALCSVLHMAGALRTHIDMGLGHMHDAYVVPCAAPPGGPGPHSSTRRQAGRLPWRRVVVVRSCS